VTAAPACCCRRWAGARGPSVSGWGAWECSMPRPPGFCVPEAAAFLDHRLSGWRVAAAEAGSVHRDRKRMSAGQSRPSSTRPRCGPAAGRLPGRGAKCHGPSGASERRSAAAAADRAGGQASSRAKPVRGSCQFASQAGSRVKPVRGSCRAAGHAEPRPASARIPTVPVSPQSSGRSGSRIAAALRGRLRPPLPAAAAGRPGATRRRGLRMPCVDPLRSRADPGEQSASAAGPPSPRLRTPAIARRPRPAPGRRRRE